MLCIEFCIDINANVYQCYGEISYCLQFAHIIVSNDITMQYMNLIAIPQE